MADADQGVAGATRSDAELLAVAKEHIGAAFGLTPQQTTRLRGETRVEIEADAEAMREELGLEPLDDGQKRDRDQSGRYAKDESTSMNQLIRKASGRR